MADLFLNKRGVISVHDVDLGIPVNMVVENFGDIFSFKSIITEFGVQARGGVQFMHTLRDFIYVYVFGERISSMVINGMSFWDVCDGGGFHGLEYINAYYLDNRVSERAAPITVVFGGGTPFFGFLTGMDIHLNNPQDYIGQYSLQFKVVPEASLLG